MIRRRRNSAVRSLPPEVSARRWDEYTLGPLSERHPLACLSDAWSYSLPLYSRIMEAAPPGGRILEIGMGSGAHLIWLALRGFEVVGVDYRQPVVHAARELAPQLGVECTYHLGDAFDLSRFRGFDLVFSVGVVEHWERQRTVLALREQAECGGTVIAVIPTPHSGLTAQVTDERFYSQRQLRKIFRDAGLTRVQTFSYGVPPNRIGRVSHLGLPHGLLRLIQDRAGLLSMSLGASGRT